MNTPICDFVEKYVQENKMRLHMPGHKGSHVLGFEAYDITEIDGADSLYEAHGIICESEHNAGKLFGCNTFYSTEGSSLCIRAMLYLTLLYGRAMDKKPVIWAGRNSHKAFLNAAAVLDFDIQWIFGNSSYLSCKIDPETLDRELSEADELPLAIYITSPDYLGNITDIAKISKVCKNHGVLLLVDNAHGAYLKFLTPSLHPMDLGADMCCDSAHKTLPVLTGGAYLHISNNAPQSFCEQAKNALALFGSTSPSYLILQSLDKANAYIADGYGDKLNKFIKEINSLKESILIPTIGNEPLKITFAPKGYGYTGEEFAKELERQNIVCEFADPDFTVLMLTPQIGQKGLNTIRDVINNIQKRTPINIAPPTLKKPVKALSPKEASLSPQEKLPVTKCTGRILANASVGCPPAVPIAVYGETIDESIIKAFKYYGIKECYVVKGN